MKKKKRYEKSPKCAGILGYEGNGEGGYWTYDGCGCDGIMEAKIRKIVRNCLNEALDREFGNRFSKYVQVTDKQEKIMDFFRKWSIIDFDRFCQENGIELDLDDNSRCKQDDPQMMKEIVYGRYSDYAEAYLEWKKRKGKHGRYPTRDLMSYRETLNNAWLIHLSESANKIWEEGFRQCVDGLDDLGITTSKNKTNEGYCFAYPVKYGFKQMFDTNGTSPLYGRKAVLFQANCVICDHTGDEDIQAVFYNNDAKNLILIERGDGELMPMGVWHIRRVDNGKILVKSKSLEKVANWAIANFDQYASLMLNPREHAYKRDAMKNSVYGK